MTMEHIDNKKVINTAMRYGACSMIIGNETVEDAIKLFITPQGLEFYKNTRWPNIAALRIYKSVIAERLGVYIDAGDIELHNPRFAVLIGDTRATIMCNDLADCTHKIVAIAGASAMVSASSWAVIATQRLGGEIKTVITDNAFELCIE